MCALKLNKTYTLRPMVLARLLAEATTLVLVAFLPAACHWWFHLAPLPVAVRSVILALAVIALAILPIFGFITYRVRVDERGLTTISLFKRQFCAWQNIKGLRRRASWNWLRYVVESRDGELTFPVLLRSCDELVHLVRVHLPMTGGTGGNPFRKFNIDPIGLLYQLLQAVGSLFFIAVCWIFFAVALQPEQTNASDTALVFAFCLACSGILAWRTYVIVLMPLSVEITKEHLLMRTLFGVRRLQWLDVLSVRQPFPLLPEGFVIHTRHGSHLIGSGMDAADELQEVLEIKTRMSASSAVPSTGAQRQPGKAAPIADGAPTLLEQLTALIPHTPSAIEGPDSAIQAQHRSKVEESSGSNEVAATGKAEESSGSNEVAATGKAEESSGSNEVAAAGKAEESSGSSEVAATGKAEESSGSNEVAATGKVEESSGLSEEGATAKAEGSMGSNELPTIPKVEGGEE